MLNSLEVVNAGCCLHFVLTIILADLVIGLICQASLLPFHHPTHLSNLEVLSPNVYIIMYWLLDHKHNQYDVMERGEGYN